MKFYNLSPYRGSNSMVRIIGHRGARGLYPENSLLGFMNVLKSGIEISLGKLIIHTHQKFDDIIKKIKS